MPGESPHTASATERHAKSLYHALEQQATTEVVNGKDTLVFRGSMTKLYSALQISQSYYSKAIKLLEHHECIIRLQRGGRVADSVVVLLGLAKSLNESDESDLTEDATVAKLRARIDTLETNTGGLNIAEVMLNFETRLAALESSSS